MGLSPAMLRAVLQNPIAVGMGRPTFFGGMPVPSVAIAIDVSGHDDEARQMTDLLEAWVSEAARGIERQRLEVDGVAMTVLQHPRRSGAIAFARSGRLLGSHQLQGLPARVRGHLPR